MGEVSCLILCSKRVVDQAHNVVWLLKALLHVLKVDNKFSYAVLNRLTPLSLFYIFYLYFVHIKIRVFFCITLES